MASQSGIGLDAGRRLVALAEKVSKLASPCVSVFYVGCAMLVDDGQCFLGVNVELPRQNLTATVHAEHFCVAAAVANGGARKVRAIGITAALCGHCRQMLAELCEKDHDIEVFFKVASANSERTGTTAAACPTTPLPPMIVQQFWLMRDLLPQAVRTELLDHLLPFAQAPGDEPCKQSEMTQESAAKLQDIASWVGPLVVDTLSLMLVNGIARARAPFTKATACCAIVAKTSAGQAEVFCGSCIESVAFNPGVPPFQSALIELISRRLDLRAPSIEAMETKLDELLQSRTEYNMSADLESVTHVILAQKEGAVIDHADSVSLFAKATCSKSADLITVLFT